MSETTPHTFQVVVDCTDPHGLADWWAETLGWEVEVQDEGFIRSMIDQGLATDADTTRHDGRLVWRTGAAINAPGDSARQLPRVLFQHVPEGKTVKNRLHLDIRVASGDVSGLRERLVARGATVLHRGSQGPHTWVTMADPEGNEFCV
jgi:Glyoxalase-like domain